MPAAPYCGACASNGLSGSLVSSFQSADLMRTANLLGSKLGRDTIARISPVLGLSATTAPRLPCMPSSATDCKSRSIVVSRFLPGVAFTSPSIARSRPMLSTTARRSPSTPTRISLYCFSRPVLPMIWP